MNQWHQIRMEQTSLSIYIHFSTIGQCPPFQTFNEDMDVTQWYLETVNENRHEYLKKIYKHKYIHWKYEPSLAL